MERPWAVSAQPKCHFGKRLPTERVQSSRPAPKVLLLMTPLHADSSAWKVRSARSNWRWKRRERPSSSRQIWMVAQTMKSAGDSFDFSIMRGLIHSWVVVE